MLGQEADEVFEQPDQTQEKEQLVLIDTHSNQATIRHLGKFIKSGQLKAGKPEIFSTGHRSTA